MSHNRLIDQSILSGQFIGGWIGGSWSACAQACAEKDKHANLPLHWALKGAAEGVVLGIIDAHPQVRRHAESRRTKEFSPLGPRAAVSWLWVPAWGSLEPSRRGGENAQKTGKTGNEWARYGLKRVNKERKGGITWEETCSMCTVVDLIRGSFFIMKSGT